MSPGLEEDKRFQTPVRSPRSRPFYKMAGNSDRTPRRRLRGRRRMSHISCNRSKRKSRWSQLPYEIPQSLHHRSDRSPRKGSSGHSPYKVPQTPHNNYDRSPRKGRSSETPYEVPQTFNTKFEWPPRKGRSSETPYEVPQTFNHKSDWSSRKGRSNDTSHEVSQTFNTKSDWSPRKGRSSDTSHEVPQTFNLKSNWSPRKGRSNDTSHEVSQTFNAKSDWSPHKGRSSEISYELPQTFNPKSELSPNKGRRGQPPCEVPQTSYMSDQSLRRGHWVQSPCEVPHASKTKSDWLSYKGYWGRPYYEIPKTFETRSCRLPYRGYWGQPPNEVSQTTTTNEIEAFPMNFHRSNCISCGQVMHPFRDFTEEIEDHDRGIKGIKTEPKCKTLYKSFRVIDLTQEEQPDGRIVEQEVVTVDEYDDVIDLVSNSSSVSPTPTTSRNCTPMCMTPVQCTSPVQDSTQDSKGNYSSPNTDLSLMVNNLHLELGRNFTRNVRCASDNSKLSMTEPLIVSCGMQDVQQGVGVTEKRVQLPTDAKKVSRSGGKKVLVDCEKRRDNGYKCDRLPNEPKRFSMSFSKKELVDCQKRCGCRQKCDQLPSDCLDVHKHLGKSSTSRGMKELTTDLTGVHKDCEKYPINGNRHGVKRKTSDENIVSHKIVKFSDDVSQICPSAIANLHKINDQRNEKQKYSNKCKRKHYDQPFYSAPSKRMNLYRNNISKTSFLNPIRRWICEKPQNDNKSATISVNDCDTASTSLSERERYTTKSQDNNMKRSLLKRKRYSTKTEDDNMKTSFPERERYSRKTQDDNMKTSHAEKETYNTKTQDDNMETSVPGRERHSTKTQDDNMETSVPGRERHSPKTQDDNMEISLPERERYDTKTRISGNNRERVSTSLPSRIRNRLKDQANNKNKPRSLNNRNVGSSLMSFFNWIKTRSVRRHSLAYASARLPPLSVATGLRETTQHANRTSVFTNCVKYVSKTSASTPVRYSNKTGSMETFGNKSANKNCFKYVSKTANSFSARDSLRKKKKNGSRKNSMEGAKLPLLNGVGPVSDLSGSTRNMEPENLDQMQHIIFLDLDNWGGFFNFLPHPLPEKTFVWVFFGGGLKSWNVPTNDIFLRLKETGCVHFHEQCGSKSNAADFAIAVSIGKMDERLPKTIPFTILSGDRDFTEVERQMKSSYRRIVIIDPHAAYSHSSAMLYALLSSVQHV